LLDNVRIRGPKASANGQVTVRVYVNWSQTLGQDKVPVVGSLYYRGGGTVKSSIEGLGGVTHHFWVWQKETNKEGGKKTTSSAAPQVPFVWEIQGERTASDKRRNHGRRIREEWVFAGWRGKGHHRMVAGGAGMVRGVYRQKFCTAEGRAR